MNVLDFIISVLKIHEKELDYKIDRLETNMERLENMMRAMEVLLMQERTEYARTHLRDLLIDALDSSFTL